MTDYERTNRFIRALIASSLATFGVVMASIYGPAWLIGAGIAFLAAVVEVAG